MGPGRTCSGSMGLQQRHSGQGWAESSVTALAAWTRASLAGAPPPASHCLAAFFVLPPAYMPLGVSFLCLCGRGSRPVLYLGPLQLEGPESVTSPGGGVPTVVPRALARSESTWSPVLCSGLKSLL